jgi:hypothetical protein
MIKPVIALWMLLLPALAGAHGPAAPSQPGAAQPAVQDKRTVAATPMSPEYVQLARNVEVIPDIEAAVKSVGVRTHEGQFGPLLFAERTRVFFLQLEPGMYLEEHPHDLGSIVYTVRGKWVLVSEGKRQVMEAGSLFRFGDRMPTGWEAPFAGGALVLIMKHMPQKQTYESFHRGLQKVQGEIDVQHKKGVPFYFDELKPDHPAVLFARSVNPDFDAVLRGIRK